MSDRLTKGEVTCLNVKAGTGIGTTIQVSNFRHIILQFGTADSANLTVKFQASSAKTAPDFSAARTVANHWDYVEVIDLEDGAAIDGDTGIAPAATDDFRNLEVNTNAFRWFNAEVTARSAGSVTIKVTGFDNA